MINYGYAKIKYYPYKLKKILILFLLLLIYTKVYSQANIFVLKAVYIEKFSRFVSWPDESLMDNKNEPFVISIFGKTPLTSNLEQIYSVHKINNKKVVIKNISSIYEIKGSHVLIISETERGNLKKILQSVKNLPILTIGDASNFAEMGVLINFFEEDNKLRFEINETAALESPLQMSFYLLNSARIVKPVKIN